MESTQPQTEMSTRIFLGGKGRSACTTDNLTAICELIVKKMCEPQRFTTLWASTVCYKDSFIFTLFKTTTTTTTTTITTTTTTTSNVGALTSRNPMGLHGL
jgi:hypothetical protein